MPPSAAAPAAATAAATSFDPVGGNPGGAGESEDNTDRDYLSTTAAQDAIALLAIALPASLPAPSATV